MSPEITRLTLILSFLTLVTSAAVPNSGVLSFALKKKPWNNRVPTTVSYSNDPGSSIQNRRGYYSINLQLGSQHAPADFLVDTGSADLWVTQEKYNPKDSSTYQNLSRPFEVHYVDGSFAEGWYGKDQIAFGDGGTVVNTVEFATAEKYKDELYVIGLSYTNYKNFPYNLKDQGLIDCAAYSLWINSADDDGGDLVFGGIDTTKYTGTLQKVPIVGTANQQSSNGSYVYPPTPGGVTVVLDKISVEGAQNSRADVVTGAAVAALLDSGTTTAVLPTSWYQAIAAAYGAKWDDGIKKSVIDKVPDEGNIVFDFSGIEIKMDITTAWQEQQVNGKTVYALGFDTQDNVPDPRSNLLFGQAFLHSAYVVYDIEHNEIALAQAVKGSVSSSDIQKIEATGIKANLAPSYSATTTYHTEFTLTTPTLSVSQ